MVAAAEPPPSVERAWRLLEDARQEQLLLHRSCKSGVADVAALRAGVHKLQSEQHRLSHKLKSKEAEASAQASGLRSVAGAEPLLDGALAAATRSGGAGGREAEVGSGARTASWSANPQPGNNPGGARSGSGAAGAEGAAGRGDGRA